MIVPDQSHAAVGIRSDDADGASVLRIQRENPAVFQQHTGFQCGTVRQSQMIRTFHHGIRNGIIFTAFFSEGSQQEACCKQPHCTAGNVFLRDHA